MKPTNGDTPAISGLKKVVSLKLRALKVHTRRVPPGPFGRPQVVDQLVAHLEAGHPKIPALLKKADFSQQLSLISAVRQRGLGKNRLAPLYEGLLANLKNSQPSLNETIQLFHGLTFDRTQTPIYQALAAKLLENFPAHLRVCEAQRMVAVLVALEAPETQELLDRLAQWFLGDSSRTDDPYVLLCVWGAPNSPNAKKLGTHLWEHLDLGSLANDQVCRLMSMCRKTEQLANLEKVVQFIRRHRMDGLTFKEGTRLMTAYGQLMNAGLTPIPGLVPGFESILATSQNLRIHDLAVGFHAVETAGLMTHRLWAQGLQRIRGLMHLASGDDLTLLASLGSGSMGGGGTGDSANDDPREDVEGLFRDIRHQALEKLSDFECSHLLSLVWSFAAANQLDTEMREKIRAHFRARGRQLDLEEPVPAPPRRLIEGCLKDQIGPDIVVSVQPKAQNVPKIPLVFPDLYVLYKPSGWRVTTESPGPEGSKEIRTPSTSNFVTEKYLKDQLPPEGNRTIQDLSCGQGFLHRLDVQTSGLLLVARNYERYWDLRFQFAAREVEKYYSTLVHGVFPPNLEMNARIRVLHSAKGGSRAQIDGSGKSAYTTAVRQKVLWHPLSDQKFSLLRVQLHTGRTHQIRAHLAHEGFPVVGDYKYGPSADDSHWCPRTFLHASQIGFVREQALNVKMDLPADLKVALNELEDLP